MACRSSHFNAEGAPTAAFGRDTMGFLTVISETGFFHTAVLMEWESYPGEKYWYGFKPKKNKAPVWGGYIDETNRRPYVNHYIQFQIPDSKLDHAYFKMYEKYS